VKGKFNYRRRNGFVVVLLDPSVGDRNGTLCVEATDLESIAKLHKICDHRDHDYRSTDGRFQ